MRVSSKDRFSVLHIGNVAGIASILSQTFRRMGHMSHVLAFRKHPFNFSADILVDTPSTPFVGGLKKFLTVMKHLQKYEILHFHAHTALKASVDVPVWKMMGKKVVVHHHGSELRGRGEKWASKKFADVIFVATPDLLEWSSDAVWIPNPINIEEYPYVGVKEHRGRLKIVHAPSNRRLKGTKYIIKAVKDLQKEGHSVELVLVEGVSHSEALKTYASADIVVDQLLIGWYGMVTIECMALGKPVCVYIREDLSSYLSGNPFVNASPKTIKDELLPLIEDFEMRREMGLKGRLFVERMHSSRRVAEKVLSFYS